MKSILSAATFSLLSAGFAFGTAVWRPLFNGVNLTGWHIAGATNYWTVDPVDSAIVGYSTTSTPYTMVFTDRADFDQYTVKYSYRLQAGCSGFFSRARELTGGALVEGMQVEAKFAGGNQSEVGSLYVHPSPGWVVQHPETYSDAIARANNQYQDVVLTVKRPYVYVNVNTWQTVGETNAAELTRGAGRVWNYTANTYVANPGRIGLQIHGGQAQMDVRFKRIAILTGCGDSTSAGYDGSWVAGLPKQAAVYEDNGTCNVTGIGTGANARESSRYLGSIERIGTEWLLPVRTPGAHTLEIVTLGGRVIFSASHPAAKDYHIAVPARPGVYVAKVKTQTASVARKIVAQ